MIQRFFRLMLVIGLLANQSAMCGAHAHHDSNPTDHSARPHVHMNGHSHQHDASSGHSHSEDSPLDLPADFDATPPLSDHDRDAVFFGDQDDLLNQSNPLAQTDLSALPLFWIVADRPLAVKPACLTPMVRAGPFGCRCAVYLQTSRLLI